MNIAPFLHEGRLTWTMTTNGYKFYTLNLIAWLREVAKVPWTLCVICCDAESYAFFRREGVPCVSYESSANKGQQRIAGFGTDDFAKWNRKKVELLYFFTAKGQELGITNTLFLDGDIVVQRDPWPVLEEEWEKGGPDFLFQCDCVGKEDHEGCGVICSGVIAHRVGSSAELYKFVLEEWIAAEKQDQPYIARRLKTLGIPYKTLRRSLWGNGEWQKGGGWLTTPWVLLHYNYRVGDTKKAAMKIFGHWRIPY